MEQFRRHLFLLIALLAIATGAHSQQQQDTVRVNVRGTVFENQSLDPIEGAQVRLLDQEGQQLRGVMTDKGGHYVLRAVPTGSYTLSVAFMGFKEQKFSVKLPNKSGNMRVADVLLREEAKVMAEAVVEGKLPEMTVVDDTVMYNADAFKLQEGALVEELIKVLPGIDKDADGNYTWNGKSIDQILVDGKEFFGNNKNMVLQNLPAEIVDKVKAYEKKSDHARITGIDDGQERTVLDLAIKKNRKHGWIGNLDGGYGTHDRYTGRLMVNRFVGDQKFSVVGNGNNTDGDGMADKQSGGANMNWQNQKLELNGSVNANFQQNSNENWNNSQNFENRNAAYTNSHNRSSGNSRNFGFNYKVEWKPDTLTNILFRPNLSYNRNHSESRNESAAFSADPYQFSADPLGDYRQLSHQIGVNHRLSRNNNDSHSFSAGGSLQVNRRLVKPGRNLTLNLDGNYSRNGSESQSYSQIDYYQILAVTGEDSVYNKIQYNDAPQTNRNLSARLSYSEPIGQQIYLQMSYQYSHRFSDRDRNVSSIFDWMQGGLQPFVEHGIDGDNYRQWPHLAAPDVAQCNYTTNTYQNHNMRLQLRVNRTRYQLTLGGNVQPQHNSVDYTKGLKHYDVSQSVVNASPTLNFRYKFSRQEQLDLRYNGNTGQPGITDLIPDTLSNADPLNIRLGNPELKPSFTQSFNGEYRRSVPDLLRSNTISYQFHTTQNATASRTEYNDETGERITKPMNINGNWNTSVNYNFTSGLGPQKYWRWAMGTDGRMTNAVGYVYRSQQKETVKNRTRGISANQRIRLTYRREWESLWQLEANANAQVRYNHSRSTNTSASNLDTYTFSYGASFNLRTPWGMNLASDITARSRRGYTDASMNTNELLWNASLSQYFMKRRSIILTLRWYDILNRRDDVSRNISATSRTDSRSRSVHSYAMLTLTLRYRQFGGRNHGRSDEMRGEGRSERPRGEGRGEGMGRGDRGNGGWGGRM